REDRPHHRRESRPDAVSRRSLGHPVRPDRPDGRAGARAMTPSDPRGPVRRIHLIGICGTGMGSLAGLLLDAGYEVRGSDESVYPPISTMLRAKGISILQGYDAAHLDDRPDLVIIGNIATRANPEATAAAERGIPFLSMPQAIARLFLEDRHSLVV